LSYSLHVLGQISKLKVGGFYFALECTIIIACSLPVHSSSAGSHSCSNTVWCCHVEWNAFLHCVRKKTCDYVFNDNLN